jgi:hypothetical protein
MVIVMQSSSSCYRLIKTTLLKGWDTKSLAKFLFWNRAAELPSGKRLIL